jgi:DNA-binding MarR family transcriptional regulator
MQDIVDTWRFALPDQDVADEIRQELAGLYPDLDTAAFGVVGRILRLARNIETWRAEHLSAYQLTHADFNVLATMRRKGDDGINPGTLLDVLLISSGGLTRRLDRLEAAGLIERHPDPEDRRGTLLRLTKEGARRIDEAIPSLLEWEDEHLRQVLTEGGLQETSSVLRRLMLNVPPATDATAG